MLTLIHYTENVCTIVGAIGTGQVSYDVYEALNMLQHRGQDAAGMAAVVEDELKVYTDSGLAQDVFTPDVFEPYSKARATIGHLRYRTQGSMDAENSQPFIDTRDHAVALAHNGNIVNESELRSEFENAGETFETESDSEVLLKTFVKSIAATSDKHGLDINTVTQAVTHVGQKCNGAYSVVALVKDLGLVAWRDPNGIRPLVIGTKAGSIMVASESAGLDRAEFERVRDVQPGELVVVHENGELQTRTYTNQAKRSPCAFEFVYLARPDSIIDGISVYDARRRMGEALAAKIMHMPEKPDVLVPVPDSGRIAALGLAEACGISYQEALIKNRYIGRTFIMPDQKARKSSIKRKLNPINHLVENKKVLLVDDSIVRGNTSAQMIALLRQVGAESIWLASVAPPIKHPNYYGISIPTFKELVARNRTDEEIARELGADGVVYQNTDDLHRAIIADSGIESVEDSCFSGEYIAGQPPVVSAGKPG